MRKGVDEWEDCGGLGRSVGGRGKNRGLRRFREECGRVWGNGKVAEVWGGMREGVKVWGRM